jgi:hypothetical protein
MQYGDRMRAWLVNLRLDGVRITGDRPPTDRVEVTCPVSSDQ